MKRGILEIMSWFTQLLTFFFPTLYTPKELGLIPKAPEPEHKNIFALFDYHSTEGKNLVYAIKKRKDIVLAHSIAKNMADLLQEYLSEQQQYSFFMNPMVIPVPLTQKQKKNRGFNQSEAIASSLADILGGKYSPHILYKNRETKKQALVSNRAERFTNVRNCFSITNNYNLHHHDIIIVDDLITTGATLSEIEKTLRAASARNVIAITVAH